MNESIDPEYIGIENNEYRFKHKFSGFNTEIRVDILSNEATILITDEIAEFFGYKSADELLGSDTHLDALNMIKSDRGVFPDFKLRSMHHITY